MYGDNNIVGCLSVSAELLNNIEIQVTTIRNTNELGISTQRLGDRLNVSTSIVCSIDSPYEYFMVTEGVFVFLDGQELKVLKNGISK